MELKLEKPQLIRGYAIRVLDSGEACNPKKVSLSGVDLLRQVQGEKEEWFHFHKELTFNWVDGDCEQQDLKARLVQRIKFKFKENHGGEELKIRQIKLFV